MGHVSAAKPWLLKTITLKVIMHILFQWWMVRRSNKSIPKETNPECSLEGLMLKLKLQYFDPLMQRPNSLE